MKKERTGIIAIALLCALAASCLLQGCGQNGANSPSPGQENAELAATDDNNKTGSETASADGAGPASSAGETPASSTGETPASTDGAGPASSINETPASAAGGGQAADGAGQAGETEGATGHAYTGAGHINTGTGLAGGGNAGTSTTSSLAAGPSASASSGETPSLSPEMLALDKKLREELENKTGDWSLYLYRLDTEEEIAINADEPMVSASLIKLYIAGCYLGRVEKGKLADDYDYQLFTMISESNNESTNTLIDVLGMDRVNRFIKKHDFTASQLNRKMLENNGKENYTSAADCGRVLREVYNWDYVSAESSGRLMKALLAQIPRNRQKIPAGVPDDIETANKTGELFIKDENGNSVAIQNDAAVIFAPGRPYILVVMTAVPGGLEGRLHSEIADLSVQVYEAVSGQAP